MLHRFLSGFLRLALGLAGALLGSLHAETGVRLVGSDLAAPALAAALEVFNRDNDRPVLASLTGSATALEQLRTGRADLGVIAVAPGTAAPAEFTLITLAYQAPVFVVAESNPVRQLSLGQLAGTFGEGELTSYRRWSDLGLTGGWGARSIVLHVERSPGSLALELFRHSALRTPQLRPTAIMHEQAAAAIARLQTEEAGLGLLASAPPAGARLKVLPIARGDQDVAFGPTPENVHAGDYPLRLPFQIAFAPERRGELFEVLRFLLSEDVAEALAAHGFVPVPRAARNQTVFQLEAP